jgi:restriction system protein
MYWLLSKEKQKEVRELIDNLVISLSEVNHKPPHADQVFPFQGRKAINHAKTAIELLTKEDDIICDPFIGSGSFIYAASMLNRIVLGNEYEPYTNRMAFTPYNLPKPENLDIAFEDFVAKIKPQIDY